MDALVRLGIPHRILTYQHDPYTAGSGAEAAQALGLDPDTVFKTLLVSVPTGRSKPKAVVAVLPVTTSLDLKAAAKVAGAKRAVMADPAVAQRVTGYVVGGISPIGQRQQLFTVVDESALAHDVVRCSGGKRGLEIELTPQDLVHVAGALVADIAIWPSSS